MSKKDVTIKDVYELVSSLRGEIKETYVTKDEFLPVKAIAFGIVSFVLISVIGALVASVVKAF